MMPNREKEKKILLFNLSLRLIGGAEKVLLEEAKYFESQRIQTYVLTFTFNNDVLFNNAYDSYIEQIGITKDNKNVVARAVEFLRKSYALRRRIRQIQPDAILGSNIWDCIILYFATLFTPFTYSTHVHGTIFWLPYDLKYARIHRGVFAEIRTSVKGHQEFIPIDAPKSNLLRKTQNEFLAVLVWIAVRKAKKIFVLSNQMKWEVYKLYAKQAVVLRGAFSEKMLTYTPHHNLKQDLEIDGRVILNVNRLEFRKRVDLLINSFKLICSKYEDVWLVIAGLGWDGEKLKKLAHELGIENRVKFIGAVDEHYKWDCIASCDVFAHPMWADFAIAAFEPLALQKKVVWSSDVEVDDKLAKNRHIFRADSNPIDFAKALEQALNTTVDEINDVSEYTWETYCGRVLDELCR